MRVFTEHRAPDLIEPVVGFRKWMLREDGELVSPLAGVVWSGEPLRARCLPRSARLRAGRRADAWHEEGAPAPDCACGVYAFHAPYSAWELDAMSLVPGVVAMWGRIEVHDDGMRAEYAQPVALGIPPLSGRRRRRGIRAAAERLGLEVVRAHQLEATAQRYGKSLPPSLLPSGRRRAQGWRI